MQESAATHAARASHFLSTCNARARSRSAEMGSVKTRVETLRVLLLRNVCSLAPSRTAPASDVCELRARVPRPPAAAVVGSLVPLPQRRPSLPGALPLPQRPRCHPLGQSLTTCPQRLLCLHPHGLAAPRSSARAMQETRHRSAWGNTADCWSCLRPHGSHHGNCKTSLASARAFSSGSK